jgi:hypothetical protein
MTNAAPNHPDTQRQLFLTGFPIYKGGERSITYQAKINLFDLERLYLLSLYTFSEVIINSRLTSYLLTQGF